MWIHFKSDSGVMNRKRYFTPEITLFCVKYFEDLGVECFNQACYTRIIALIRV